ncbi:sigma-54 interaction domain-containing protein [Methyloterricola oryzae]|uniref:sigma-54 interaction domain-containing protein n=1 Tax=Methyloterricola oryzae TaxID=1495050 RepID=UPI0009E623C8|nr:sigma-54 dependent transcriptional regulator [Methyloterricola oryzae]
MSHSSFSQLSPTGFLQTFVLELMHVCVEAGISPVEQLIEQIARSASRFFEEAFREEFGLEGTLSQAQYAELIVGLKNRIGGDFSLHSIDEHCIRVVNSRCPFGDGVKNSPELCRMTSSVFGGIAARNFGYARVELASRIARGDSGCDVRIHLQREQARDLPGIEYQVPVSDNDNRKTFDELHARIEEQMHRIWCQMNAGRGRDESAKPPTIIARSAAMQSVLQAVETVAPTPATVLIRGETGVGKELVARAIHAMSERCHQPFIAVNCGAIPEGIVESVLFGHEKGAFTGAVEVHQGYFERANGGTLFLDEVDALTPAIQTRLLRVIQEGEIERVGGHRSLSVDTRIVSATNCDLEAAVADGRFRKDLYYRINVVKLQIPPLSQRPEDLPYLVDLILRRLSKRYKKPINGVTADVMRQLRSYAWPGNVRELENTLEKAVLFSQQSEIAEISLAEMEPAPPGQSWKHIRQQALEQLERRYLEQSLQEAQGNVNSVAAAMELTPRAVYQKLKAYGVDPAAFRAKQ